MIGDGSRAPRERGSLITYHPSLVTLLQFGKLRLQFLEPGAGTRQHFALHVELLARHQVEAAECRSAGYRRIGRTTTGDYMTSQNVFEEIDRKMKEILARGPAADLEKNLRALLASAFGRLDLVTREEFDVQREVLARTRARLQELEAKLVELEKPGDRQIGKS